MRCASARNEVDVLTGLDLDRWAPRLLMVEANDIPALSAHMSRYPYIDGGRVESDLIYIRDDQAEMLERLKWMRLL